MPNHLTRPEAHLLQQAEFARSAAMDAIHQGTNLRGVARDLEIASAFYAQAATELALRLRVENGRQAP